MTLRRRRPGLVYPTWEDWHYVGEAGEPAFGTDWTNVGTPWPAMAYRLREAGVVDIVGTVAAGATPAAIVFTLPAEYQPNEQAFMPFVIQLAGVKSGGLLVVNNTGDVIPQDFAPTAYAYIYGSFFLDTAAP